VHSEVALKDAENTLAYESESSTVVHEIKHFPQALIILWMACTSARTLLGISSQMPMMSQCILNPSNLHQ
jgi:hypothetical protein